MNTETLKLLLIRTDKGCFVKRKSGPSYTLSHLLFDGEHPETSHDCSWFCVDSEPSEVTRPLPALKENYRQILKAEFLSSEGFSAHTLGKLEPEIPRDKCMIYDDYDGWEWRKEFEHLKSLYELKWDEIEQAPEPVAFECELHCEISDIVAYSGMSYPTAGKWTSDFGKFKIADQHIGRRAIDKIIYPNVLHPACTAIMSSDNLYKIVRYHIKQNIDYRYADIKSDYEFCLTVVKRIIECKDYNPDLAKPTNRHEVMNKARSESVIFEATPASQAYKGYTVLPKLEAKNNAALKRKIDKYLRDLIAYINKPITVCEHCNGSGVAEAYDKFNHPE